MLETPIGLQVQLCEYKYRSGILVIPTIFQRKARSVLRGLFLFLQMADRFGGNDELLVGITCQLSLTLAQARWIVTSTLGGKSEDRHHHDHYLNAVVSSTINYNVDGVEAQRWAAGNNRFDYQRQRARSERWKTRMRPATSTVKRRRFSGGEKSVAQQCGSQGSQHPPQNRATGFLESVPFQGPCIISCRHNDGVAQQVSRCPPSLDHRTNGRNRETGNGDMTKSKDTPM